MLLIHAGIRQFLHGTGGNFGQSHNEPDNLGVFLNIFPKFRGAIFTHSTKESVDETGSFVVYLLYE
jgi:hypothetical protein